MNSPFFVSVMATKDKLAPVLGTFQKGTDVENVIIHVLEAFDGGATIKVGHADNDDAYATAISVTTTGRKTPTLGSEIGISTSVRLATAYVTGTPTQGKAIIVIDGKILQIGN